MDDSTAPHDLFALFECSTPPANDDDDVPVRLPPEVVAEIEKRALKKLREDNRGNPLLRFLE